MVKLVLFVGEIAPHGESLRKELISKGYSCSKVKLGDEVDQAGKQLGRALLVFTDHKFAYRFLMENRWPDFPTLHLLYLHAPAKVNPENQRKLDQVHLKLYDVKKNEALMDIMNKFLSNSLEVQKEDEIEFSASSAIGADDD